jgi:hypothetical protein
MTSNNVAETLAVDTIKNVRGIDDFVEHRIFRQILFNTIP